MPQDITTSFPISATLLLKDYCTKIKFPSVVGAWMSSKPAWRHFMTYTHMAIINIWKTTYPMVAELAGQRSENQWLPLLDHSSYSAHTKHAKMVTNMHVQPLL